MLVPDQEEIKQLISSKLLFIKPNSKPFLGDTLLYASTGILNSIELVLLIVDVEQEIRLRYQLNIVIASSKAMSQKNSPFNTINSFTNFIFEELNIINTPKES